MSPTFKAYITKHALGRGIFEAKGEERDDCFYYKEGNELKHARPKEWFRSKEEAAVKAEDMRKRKIASLQKEMEKLESMKF